MCAVRTNSQHVRNNDILKMERLFSKQEEIFSVKKRLTSVQMLLVYYKLFIHYRWVFIPHGAAHAVHHTHSHSPVEDNYQQCAHLVWHNWMHLNNWDISYTSCFGHYWYTAMAIQLFALSPIFLVVLANLLSGSGQYGILGLPVDPNTFTLEQVIYYCKLPQFHLAPYIVGVIAGTLYYYQRPDTHQQRQMTTTQAHAIYKKICVMLKFTSLIVLIIPLIVTPISFLMLPEGADFQQIPKFTQFWIVLAVVYYWSLLQPLPGAYLMMKYKDLGKSRRAARSGSEKRPSAVVPQTVGGLVSGVEGSVSGVGGVARGALRRCNRLWSPLSKLVFSVYLVHDMIADYIIYNESSVLEDAVTRYLGDHFRVYILSFPVSFFIYVVFEMPIRRLTAVLVKRIEGDQVHRDHAPEKHA